MIHSKCLRRSEYLWGLMPGEFKWIQTLRWLPWETAIACHSNFWTDKIFHLRSVHQCLRRHLRPVSPQQREDPTTVLIQVGGLKRMRHQKVYQKLSKPLSESLWYQYSGMFLMFTFCIHPCHNYTGRGVSNMKQYFWGFDARRAREILSTHIARQPAEI